MANRVFLLVLVVGTLTLWLAPRPQPELPELEPVLGPDSHGLLYAHLQELASVQFDARDRSVELAMTSPEAAMARVARLRGTYVSLVGPLPPRTDLNAQVSGTLEGPGFRIEKVVFESRPGHHVTANLYLPVPATTPVPGVLFTCGHAGIGKAAPAYQRTAQLLARNGFVVLVVDPIGDGERYQFLDGRGNPAVLDRTVEHSLLFSGAVFVGSSLVAHELWDNLRALDYLSGRPEVDPTRIGATGNSGGATQATFLLPVDDRIDVAALSCFIMQRRDLFATIGPQDGCQHIPGEGAFGLDHSDYLTMSAPRSVLLAAAERDFFDFASTQKASAELSRFYDLLGIPDATRLFSFDDTHGFSQPRREAVTAWMREWLADEHVAVLETPGDVFPEEALRAVPAGQVLAQFEHEISLPNLSLRRARELEDSRREFRASVTNSEFLARVGEVIGLNALPSKATLQIRRARVRDAVTVSDVIVDRPGAVPLPVRVYVDSSATHPQPLTLLIDDRGKDRAGDVIAAELKAGRTVVAIDLRGFGELADEFPVAFGVGTSQFEHRTAMLALHLGEPLLGQRVGDTLAVLEVFLRDGDLSPENTRLIAIGQAGPVGIHAAALDDRITHLTLQRSLGSFVHLLEQPLRFHQLGLAVPGALLWYDLPDLIAVTRARGGRVDPEG